MPANSCLFTHPADVQQHWHSFRVVFLALNSLMLHHVHQLVYNFVSLVLVGSIRWVYQNFL